jgi:hypothetical protein
VKYHVTISTPRWMDDEEEEYMMERVSDTLCQFVPVDHFEIEQENE